MAQPLRKVIGTSWALGKDSFGNTARVLKDKLECGHLHEITKDKFGRNTMPEKRRCNACAGLKSQMRPESVN